MLFLPGLSYGQSALQFKTSHMANFRQHSGPIFKMSSCQKPKHYSISLSTLKISQVIAVGRLVFRNFSLSREHSIMILWCQPLILWSLSICLTYSWRTRNQFCWLVILVSCSAFFVWKKIEFSYHYLPQLLSQDKAKGSTVSHWVKIKQKRKNSLWCQTQRNHRYLHWRCQHALVGKIRSPAYYWVIEVFYRLPRFLWQAETILEANCWYYYGEMWSYTQLRQE